MEQQRQAQLVHGAVFGQLLRQRQQHPVDLGAQSVVILRQQGFFHLLGVEIGHPGGALLLHLGEEIDRLVAHKGALLGAAVGLLVGLGQHPRLGAQVADPGGEGHARLVPGGLLDGFDVGPDVIGGDLVPAAVEDHQVLPVQQKGQPVEPAPRQGGHGLPHPAPEGHLVGALVPAVAVQDERRDCRLSRSMPASVSMGRKRSVSSGVATPPSSADSQAWKCRSTLSVIWARRSRSWSMEAFSRRNVSSKSSMSVGLSRYSATWLRMDIFRYLKSL